MSIKQFFSKTSYKKIFKGIVVLTSLITGSKAAIEYYRTHMFPILVYESDKAIVPVQLGEQDYNYYFDTYRFENVGVSTATNIRILVSIPQISSETARYKLVERSTQAMAANAIVVKTSSGVTILGNSLQKFEFASPFLDPTNIGIWKWQGVQSIDDFQKNVENGSGK
jgi:hypothetical protein